MSTERNPDIYGYWASQNYWQSRHAANGRTWKWFPIPQAWKLRLGRDFEWNVAQVDSLQSGRE